MFVVQNVLKYFSWIKLKQLLKLYDDGCYNNIWQLHPMGAIGPCKPFETLVELNTRAT